MGCDNEFDSRTPPDFVYNWLAWGVRLTGGNVMCNTGVSSLLPSRLTTSSASRRELCSFLVQETFTLRPCHTNNCCSRSIVDELSRGFNERNLQHFI